MTESVEELDQRNFSQLLAAVGRDRDIEAFETIFKYYGPKVRAYMAKLARDGQAAEELMQETMLAVWNKAEQFDPTRGNVSSWIFTIARNRRIDALRKARRPEPEELPWGPEPEPDQAEVLEAQQDTERLGAALSQLPEKQRALIERAFYGDLSHSEIAAETGLPLGTIKSRIRLALDRLRQQMT